MRGSLNSITNYSENGQEGFKVVVEDKWSLNLSGRKQDFDCTIIRHKKSHISLCRLKSTNSHQGDQ